VVRGRGRGRIWGRDREFAELRAALAGADGRLVVVRGPAGIGRSALVDAMERELRADGTHVLRLPVADPDRGSEDAFGIAPLVHAVRTEFEEFGDFRLAGSLGALVSLRDQAVRDGNGWAPQLIAEFQALFDHVAGRGRAAILLDDAHLFGQPAPLLVAARRSGCQVLVSCRDDAGSTGAVTELLSMADLVLSLGPVGDEHIARMARHAVGAKLDDAVIDGLRRALGPLYTNPATVLDTLANLRRDGGLARVHDCLCLAVPPSRIGLPPGHDLLRKSESVGPLGTRLLFAVVVLDEVNADSLPMVAAALGEPLPDCGRVFDALVEGGVLVPDRDSGALRCHCPALAVSAADLGDAEEAARLHASVAEELLGRGQRGERVAPKLLADHLAGGGAAAPVDAGLCAWLVELSGSAAAEEPEAAARWCAAAMRHLPPTSAEYASAARSLLRLVLRTGQYELLAEVLTRFARRGGPPEAAADLLTAAGLVALHTGAEPADEVVRGLLNRAYVESSAVPFAEWWFGQELLPSADSVSVGEPIPRAALPVPVSAEHVELLRASSDEGAGLFPPAPDPDRLHAAGWVADIGGVLRAAIGDGYRLPRNGVLGAYHRLVHDFAEADWSAAMSAVRELELTGCGDTLVHHAGRLFTAEICCGRGQLAQAREWLAGAAPRRRLAALRAYAEISLCAAENEPTEAVRVALRACAEFTDATPRGGLGRTLVHGMHVAVSAGDTDGVAALLEELERLHGRGFWRHTPENVYLGRGLAHGDELYLRVAADLVRSRGDRPALLEVCLALGRFAEDPRPWLLEAREIAQRCGATVAMDRVRTLNRERGVSSPRTRGQQEKLTATEQRVIELIRAGLTNRQIALELGVTEKTVENRLTRLFARTGSRSRVELAASGIDGRMDRTAP
jgi:DNA-binding CsgD family transcriptional regulator